MAVDGKYASIILKRVCENAPEQVELISGDGKRIPIHRVILTAVSKHFAAELGPNWNFQESNREEGKWLEGTDGESLRMIVNYCYTGHITLTEENVRSFLTIASFYQFDLLEEKCCSFYAKILSVNNSVETLMLAYKYNYAELRQTASDFICEHFELVPTAEIQKLDHQLFQDILESDEISSSEKLIFDRLLKWSEHGERKQHVPNLLELIQLKHIKIEILKDTVEAFYRKFGCTELMLAEYRRRASGSQFDCGFRRGYSFFCLSTNYCNEHQYSTIKVKRFDTKSIFWKEIAEFNLPERAYFTMVLNQNTIYVLGGEPNGNTVSSFDLISRQEEILPNMNIRRTCCTSIQLEEYIYVFGGWDLFSGVLNSCERFDTKRKTWTEIKSMSMGRSKASAAVMNGCIYIAGGRDKRGMMNTFECYDPVRNVWKELAPMNFRRKNFALIRLNGFIYACGGDDNDTIEKYDPSKNQWTKIRMLENGRITSGINVNGEIFVINWNIIKQINIDESGNWSYSSDFGGFMLNCGGSLF